MEEWGVRVGCVLVGIVIGWWLKGWREYYRG